MQKAIALPGANVTLNADGVPYSAAFDDIYHSAAGAAEQARHVFLAGNGLPARWHGRDCFTIVETGFGLGLNFLETWRALEDDAQAPGRLHFVSVESHPLSRDDFARMLVRWPEHAARARALIAVWPLPLAGFHRLHFAAGHTMLALTLLLGDAASQLPQLVASADAFYLDGFAPAKNPGIWSGEVFAALARLAAPGATLATWTVAASVRDGLASAGFAVDKRAGFGSKRHMLAGRWAGPGTQASVTLDDASRTGPGRGADRCAEKRAIVIGAGLAGASCAERLAARGWSVTVLERHAGPAREASGNPLGLATPLLNLADGVNARFSRAAFLYALRQYAALGENLAWRTTGVLRIARDERDAERFEKLLRELACPDELARFADKREGRTRAGWPVSRPGMWFPAGAAIDPASACAANLAHWGASVQLRFGINTGRIERGAQGWQAFDARDRLIAAAPVLVLAGGADMLSLLSLRQARDLRLERIRGQITLLPVDPGRRLNVAISGDRHAVTLPDGRLMIGATFQPGDEDTAVRAAEHAENLAGLDALLPGFCAGASGATLSGRTAFRMATPDRLPLFGALSTKTTTSATDAAPNLYVASGLGARGLVWAPLGAELLAAQITGEPWPVARELADAVAPGRFGGRD